MVSRKNVYDEVKLSSHQKRKIETIEDIKSNGSFVCIHCADISNSRSVEKLIKEIKKEYGNIRGLIHTAGAEPLGLGKHNLSEIKGAFKAKIFGIENVLNEFGAGQLKFVASTSSLASVMGDVSRVEYCASNGYLDYLAVSKVWGNTQFLSVNWPGWTEVGMSVDGKERLNDSVENESMSMKLIRENAVNPQEGAEIFYQLIHQNKYNQIAVTKLNINGLKKFLFEQDECDVKSKEKIVKILENNYTENEGQIAQLFSDILGIEEVSIHDDFFKLGGNSILAIQLSHRLNKILNCEFKVADVFTLRDCKSLAKNIKILKANLDNVIIEF